MDNLAISTFPGKKITKNTLQFIDIDCNSASGQVSLTLRDLDIFYAHLALEVDSNMKDTASHTKEITGYKVRTEL